MSIKTALAKYGSGVGYIYLTDSDNNIVRNIPNTPEGREFAERQMLVSSSLISNISASGTITVTAAGGTITNLSYNGVAVFNTATPIAGATVAATATNIATAINSHISVPNYTAVSSGDTVTVYLEADQGSSLNNTALASSVTGATTITSTELDGGSYPTGEIDSQLGYKLYLNPSVSAVIDTLTGATDVTSGVLRKSSTSPYSVKDVEVSSGSVSIDRDGAVSIVSVQTEGAVAADDLTSIDAGVFSDGDTIIIRGKESGKVTTVKEGGNIELANNSDFLTGAKDNSLTLQFSISDNKWYEIGRSPGDSLTVSSLRSANIATPVQGVNSEAIVLGGSTTTLTAGTSKGYYQLTGSGTLTGSVSYGLASGLVDGDTFIIDYNATITLGGFVITIATVQLTASQALEGDIFVKAVWDGANSVWVVSLFKDTQGIDLADSTDLATKEGVLGNPASDGYVLSSTAAGVRSWVSNSTSIYYDNSTTQTQNSAGVETTLRTISVPANTLSSSGSKLVVEVLGRFNSNAHAKTLRLKFNNVLICANTNTTAPNGLSFIATFNLQNIGSANARCSGSIQIDGVVNEIGRVDVSGLSLSSTSYDITITGEGVSSGDVLVTAHSAFKYIA